jgi:zinc protease
VEAALDEELSTFLEDGPDVDELDRAKTRRRATFIRGIERVGGFGGKSDVLAASEVYLGDPDGYKQSQTRIIDASTEDVRAAASEWLSEGTLTVEVHPFPAYSVSETDVDRSMGPPSTTDFPRGDFPEFERATLSNGLEVILAQHGTVPLVNFNLLLDAGYASDQFSLPGTARLAMAMLDEGTTSRSALEISDELASLETTLSASSNLDRSSVSMSTLKENLDASLGLFTDVILNPSFPENEFTRLRQQQLAAIQQEKVQPVGMALRVFPRVLYGEGHAYGNPLTGSGTEKSVKEITLGSLRSFHDTWFRPNNATLIVVGDITMREVVPALEARFADWEQGEVPKKNLDVVDPPTSSVVYLLDRPGSEQSMIFAGNVAPPKGDPDDLKIEALNDILGGSFTARINMNLREGKHWSYGARTILLDAAGQRPFFAYAPVQTDKTAESMTEILNEFNGIGNGGDLPPTEEELARIKDKKTLTLPGRWETNGAVMADIVEMVRFGLPDDHWSQFPSEVRSLSLEDVAHEADRLLHPDRLIWVVVGDRQKVEPSIEELGLGSIRPIDADGKPAGTK